MHGIGRIWLCTASEFARVLLLFAAPGATLAGTPAASGRLGRRAEAGACGGRSDQAVGLKTRGRSIAPWRYGLTAGRSAASPGALALRAHSGADVVWNRVNHEYTINGLPEKCSDEI